MTNPPLNNRVVIQRAKPAEITKEGVLIPTTAQDKIEEGIVLAVGPKVEELGEGDRVVFGKYVGTEVTVDGETLFVLREDDVVAVIR
jgi:chaperonin GroES